ncbi:MAG: hypothetical protein COS95_06335 [Ignavibacteriales bacterium CG07_land_8_20_14_0_80_59_12]|nr:MAG: hypothetical protein COS95_06335 [Ignavibacteriales bacterium CG07_land_8_20_14_0_80_59_12]
MKQSSERAIIQRSVPDDLLIRQRNGKPRIFRVERWSLVEKIDTTGISDLDDMTVVVVKLL